MPHGNADSVQFIVIMHHLSCDWRKISYVLCDPNRSIFVHLTQDISGNYHISVFILVYYIEITPLLRQTFYTKVR